jgi:ATP-binding cassette subfamily B protein
MGHSGAGKTSIANLILRLYEINSGDILIDNHKIQDISLSSLRQQIGFVSQDIILFDQTIEENIRLGNLEASKSDIIDAAKNADIHDFIDNLPEQYMTLCGEGGNRFSGGERQRIALARALVRKPSMLILDEATSALDPISEQSIIATLHKLKNKFTIIAITHKVNLAEEADLVYIIDKGRIIEKGSPLDLMNHGGIYEQFLQTQS